MSARFHAINRNKLSVTFEIKKPLDLEGLKMRPGDAESLVLAVWYIPDG